MIKGSITKCVECNTDIVQRYSRLKKYCTMDCQRKGVSKAVILTNNILYGCNSPAQLPEVKDKILKTMVSNYGVENPMRSEELKLKQKAALLKNHGVENPMQSPILRDKAKVTNKILYGHECLFKSPEILNRIKTTNMMLYGVENWACSHISPSAFVLLNDIEWLREQNLTKSIVQVSHELGVSVTTVCRKFEENGIAIKHHAKSFFEKQVFEFVKSIYPDIEQNDRKQIKPLELDIWIPKLRMAIECNGRYFHQDQEKEQRKLDMCKEKGIDLHIIWDDHWENDRQSIEFELHGLIFGKLNGM